MHPSNNPHAPLPTPQTEREASLRATHEVLCSLWGALGTPEDAPERAAVSRLLAGDRPNRLHRRTLDKVRVC